MKVLIVVDMQKDFVDGALGSAEAVAIVPTVKALIEGFDGEVYFTRDTHFENYFSTQEGEKLPVLHCIKDTRGWEIADGLFEENERVFDKPTFGSVQLAEFVKEERFDEVELVGVCTDICVVSNALLIKAYCPEIKVQVRADCCAGVTKESHEAALKTMSSCQVEIL